MILTTKFWVYTSADSKKKTHIMRWIAPEDLVKEIKRRQNSSSREEWEKSKYRSRLQNLMNLNKEVLQSISRNRSNDVTLAKLRTKTIPTNEILAKCKLLELDNPACKCGYYNEDIEHIILSCKMYEKKTEKNSETRWG